MVAPEALAGRDPQPRFAETIIRRTGARRILELGSGNGFNSNYLARRNPDADFTGVDLRPRHVDIATARAQGLPNVRFVQGDFHRLDMIGDGSIDLVLDAEAGCYSDTPEKIRQLYADIRRVLRPGGHFVVWGYYRSRDFSERSPVQRRAVDLIEQAWVTKRFPPIDEWDVAARAAGFTFESTEHLEYAVMPSIRRLYRAARLYYRIRPAFKWLLGQPTHNSVSVLLLPYAFMMGALKYRQAVLVRGE